MSKFTDELTWYPGIEIRNNGALFFRDIDASVVVPSVGNAPYSTRVVGEAGNPRPDAYGADIGIGSLLGTGNPVDDGVSFHTIFEVLEVKSGNTAAKIHIVPPTP